MGNWEYELKVGQYLEEFRRSGLDGTTDEGVDAIKTVAKAVGDQIRSLPHWYTDEEYNALDPMADATERGEAFQPRQLVKYLEEAESIKDFDWAYTQLALWADEHRVLLGG